VEVTGGTRKNKIISFIIGGFDQIEMDGCSNEGK
jgi:hypothetical protein